MDDLNKKLLEWAELIEIRAVTETNRDGNEYESQAYFWKSPRQRITFSLLQVGFYPGFLELTSDLSSCFRLLVPKLDQAQYYEVLRSIFLKTDNPALVFCKAMEKLIDGKKEE